MVSYRIPGELVDSPKLSSFTDMEGQFEYEDWTPHNDEIDPVIRIAHDCNDGVKVSENLFFFFARATTRDAG